MRRFLKGRAPQSSALSSAAPGILVACGLWLLLSAAASAQVRPARPDPPQDGRQTDASPFDEEEEESESTDNESRVRPRVTDPAAVLRTARTVYVRSDTAFVNAREVEASLLKRKEFRAWGMTITRNETEADLVIEISRKALTRRFTFTVLEPRTMSVVTGGKTRSVLFGKKIPNKIAEKFTNRLRLVRPYPPVGP